MKPLAPAIKDALRMFKTPLEALIYSQFDGCAAADMEYSGLIVWMTGDDDGRYILTPDGVKAWEELQHE